MSKTLIRRVFGGVERSFDLRIGEITALERCCNAGLYGILHRIAGHQAYASDIRDTIRLGLKGGGMSDAESSALIAAELDGYPLSDHLPLAAEIINSVINGLPEPEQIPEDDESGKTTAEGMTSAASPPGGPSDT